MSKPHVQGAKPYLKRKCLDKITHPSYEAAWEVANRHWINNNEKLVPYKCPICIGYHVGHQLNENDLSTAFIPIKKLPNKTQLKPNPVKKKSVTAQVKPPTVPKLTWAQELKAIKKQRDHEARIYAERFGIESGLYSWQLAIDDGWNLHLTE